MTVNAFFAWLQAFAAAWSSYAYIAVATCLTWEVVRWSEGYAATALAAHADLQGTALVIGAVSAVAGAVQAFAFKHHLDSREA